METRIRSIVERIRSHAGQSGEKLIEQILAGGERTEDVLDAVSKEYGDLYTYTITTNASISVRCQERALKALLHIVNASDKNDPEHLDCAESQAADIERLMAS